jgi:[acyl-carrier-protein] S-malonyltransferase
MGKDLADQFAIARQTLEEADEALGFKLTSLCFEGPAEELQLTANTQPAILACSVATYRVIRENGIAPAYLAGHSLGEYSALVAAGSLSFADALRIVRHRGQYMQEAVPAGTGAMAALIGLERAKVEELCVFSSDGEVVSPANFNSPDQIVVAGAAGAVERLVQAATAAGAKKAVMLKVSAPFHCSLMLPAQERLMPELQATAFAHPDPPLINNVRAEEVRTGEAARQGVIDQIPAPVLWEDSVRKMRSLGVNTFIEVGPGRVLTALMRQIDRDAQALNVEDLKSLEKTLAALSTPAGDGHLKG